MALLGATMIWGMGGAAMNFSTNARIVWPVLAVTSIFLRLQTGALASNTGRSAQDASGNSFE